MASAAHISKQKKQSSKKKASTVLNATARKARQQAKEIIHALTEAEQIHKGKRKGKTFGEFIEEL